MTQQIFAFGTNFNQLSSITRSRLAFDGSVLKNLSDNSSVNDFLYINTCNRSEIYGVGDVAVLEQKIFNSISVSEEDKKYFFSYQGKQAVEHIFSVVCGLNSQIVGDNEIAGQFKNAYQEAKTAKPINGFIEKMVNLCLQASKEIKTNTDLSNGTKSVAYAATKYISRLRLNANSKILVVGTGDIGKVVAKNLKQHLPLVDLTLCNRTDASAEILANELNTNHLLFKNLSEQIINYDIVVSSVSIKNEPLFTTNFNWNKDKVNIIDLAMPVSVAANLHELPQITIKNLDEISKEIEETAIRRNEAVPMAKKIMKKHVAEFMSWSKVYANKTAITEWQDKFEEASKKCPFLLDISEKEKHTLKYKSTALFVEYIREASPEELQTNKILEKYVTDNSDNKVCLCVEDCLKTKLNCDRCN